MSERSIIVSVLLALMMIGVWRLSVITGAPTDTTPVALLDFDPAAVDRIELTSPLSSGTSGEPSVVIERKQVFGSSRWMVRWEADGVPVAWPADEGRVRAGLRVLLTSVIEPRSDHTALTGGLLTLTMADGTTQSIRFGNDPLAGRIEVETTSNSAKRGLTDASLYEAFIRTGLLAWRDGHALLAFGAGPGHFDLQSPSGTLVMIRRQGRWSMLEPLQSLVRPEAAKELAGHLAALPIEGFDRLQGGEDTQRGFAQPLATIVAETDFRLREGDATEPGLLRQTMVVGRPTDATGQQVFVRLEWLRLTASSPPETIAGPIIGRVATEVLNKLTTRPEPYIDPHTLATLPASVERITIRSGTKKSVLERDARNWRDANEPLLPDENELIDTVLFLLIEGEADAITVIDDNGLNADAAVSLEIVTSDGSRPQTIFIFASDESLLAVIGPIARKYPHSGPLVAALNALVTRTGVSQSDSTRTEQVNP